MSDELREAAQVILDRCLDFFGADDPDPDSSEAMPVVIKNRWVYNLRAALAARPDSPTLDVERLAQAMHGSYERDPTMTRIEWDDLGDAEKRMWRRHAKEVRDRYAADTPERPA